MEHIVVAYSYNNRIEGRVVDLEKYGYIEMLYDIYNSILKHIPEGRTLSFTFKFSLPNGGGDVEVKSDQDIVKVCSICGPEGYMNLKVCNVDSAAKSTSPYTINGYPSKLIARENQQNMKWINCQPDPTFTSCVDNGRGKTKSVIPQRVQKIPVKRGGGSTCKASSRSSSTMDDRGSGSSIVRTLSMTTEMVAVGKTNAVKVTSNADVNHSITNGQLSVGERNRVVTPSVTEVTIGENSSSSEADLIGNKANEGCDETFNFADLLDDEWNDGSDSGGDDSSDEQYHQNKELGNDSNDALSDYHSDNEYAKKQGEGDEFFDGQVFADVHAFRAALHEFSIKGGFDILRIENEKKRCTVVCAAEGCCWRVHASLTEDEKTYMIKSLNPVHTCGRLSRNKNATSTWIVQKLGPQLRADPDMTYESMSQILNEKYGIQPHHMQLYRARVKAKEQNEGSHGKSYSQLPKYGKMVLEQNPGSIFKLQYQERLDIAYPLVFKRLFICFDACKTGFIKGCRPFIGLDGWHIKSPYGGVILAVISLDGNNGLFLVAYAVVEVECKDSWSFFLYNLYASTFSATTSSSLTFMSDKQKGLHESIADIFSDAQHRHCARHLYNNFKAKYPGILLRTQLWQAAKSYTQASFQRAMNGMLNENKEAHDWLMRTPPLCGANMLSIIGQKVNISRTI